MAWFHKSLTEMQAAIEAEDWPKVKEILQQHNRHLDSKSKKIKHDISDISLAISDYSQHLSQISSMLKSLEKHGSNTKDLMELKVKAAIECAWKFEKTIMHLIKEGKFLE